MHTQRCPVANGGYTSPIVGAKVYTFDDNTSVPSISGDYQLVTGTSSSYARPAYVNSSNDIAYDATRYLVVPNQQFPALTENAPYPVARGKICRGRSLGKQVVTAI